MTAYAALDDQHALYCGWVLGIAHKHGVPFEPVLDDAGNYTNRIELRWSTDKTITLVIPHPPENWEPFT